MKAVCSGARRAVEWLKEVAGAQFVSAGAEPMYQFMLSPSSVGKFGRQWQGRGADVLVQSLENKLKVLAGELRRDTAVGSLEMKKGANLLRRSARTGRGDGLRMARAAGAAFIKAVLTGLCAAEPLSR